MIVAHRGASSEAPENTLPAFELAWKQQAGAIEGDFRLTRDGQIVCIHNEDTKEVTGQELVVKDTTLEDLRKLDVGTKRGGKYIKALIPTIDEVFATIPKGKVIYIEIKCGTEIIPAMFKAIEKAGLTEQQVVFISFDDQVIEALKTQATQYRALWLCKFKKGFTGGMKPSVRTVLKTLKRTRADGLSSNTLVPHSVIEAVHNADYEWHVWTVDNPKVGKQMQALGAKSITTNKPGKMREGLGEERLKAEEK